MIKIGIVGKPNVGKSTFFEAATLKPVKKSPVPFTTIEPNVGVGYVRKKSVCTEFNVKCNPVDGSYCNGRFRYIPIQIVDVAGLVEGAHLGRGLGNQFLDNLREADGLILVVDVSGYTGKDGELLSEPTYDPTEDVKFVLDEIDYWIFNILKRNFEKIVKKVKYAKEDLLECLYSTLCGLSIKKEHIKNVLLELNLLDTDVASWTDEDLFNIAKKIREISKPIVIAANKIDIGNSKENIEKLRKMYPNIPIIPTSAEAELILNKLSRNGKIEYYPGDNDFKIKSKLSEKEEKVLNFIKDNILDKYNSTGVQLAIDTLVKDILGYICFFPVANDRLEDKKGNILPNVFLVRKGTKIIEAAEIVHSDFAKGFIRAISIRDGKIFGRDDLVRDRDVIRFIVRS